MTSNQNNIALLNEFFFYLLKNIRENKGELIDQLMQDYREEFSSSSSRDLAPSL
jgi:adenylate cyclase